MELKEYKRKTGNWFSGKTAIANIEIKNCAGDVINKGEKVIISCKSGKGGFNIRSEAGVYISQVSPGKIDLVNE